MKQADTVVMQIKPLTRIKAGLDTLPVRQKHTHIANVAVPALLVTYSSADRYFLRVSVVSSTC